MNRLAARRRILRGYKHRRACWLNARLAAALEHHLGRRPTIAELCTAILAEYPPGFLIRAVPRKGKRVKREGSPYAPVQRES